MKKLFFFLVTLMLPMVANADDSGTCGDNLTWYYEGSSKTLTISGSGEMFLPSLGESPWMDYRSEIVKLIIEEGVTSIYHYAFADCENIIYISLPNSLMSIGGHAFEGCSGIILSLFPIVSLPSEFVLFKTVRE